MSLRLLFWLIFSVALIRDVHHAGMTFDFELHAIFYLIVSLLSVCSLVILLESIPEFFIRRSVFTFVAFLFGIAFYFAKRSHHPFGFSLISNHYEHFFAFNFIFIFFEIIRESFIAADFFWSTVFSLFIYFSFSIEKFNSLGRRPSSKLALGAFIFIVASGLLLPYTFEPQTQFIRSMYRYFRPEENKLTAKAQTLSLSDSIVIKSHFKKNRRPHIFVVMVESFNSRFINERVIDGREFTPEMNKLSKKYLSLQKYFSNSTYTAKGQFAALCGQIPSIRRSEFKNPECFHKRCLARLLADQGYQTSFFQADPNLDSENTRNFLLRNGFDMMPEISPPCGRDTQRCYSFGVKDQVFYDRVFDYAAKNLSPGRPQFVVLATAASHMPFTFQDPTERVFFPNPKNIRENYLNTLTIVDDGLKRLIERFKSSKFSEDSILVVTGDHGFPLGEHRKGGLNASHAYLENFGVPFLLIDTKLDLKKQYPDLENKAFSHLNLAPTLLDLAGIELTTDFIHDSIFNRNNNPLIYLIQPHSGGHQSVIDWPLNIIYSEFKKSETFYDLKGDYSQLNPLINLSQEKSDNLLTKTAQIYRQQDVFKCP